MSFSYRLSGDRARQRGVTLIELMTALVLVGILLAAALPAFTQVINNNRLAGFSNELVALLQAGRLEAVRNGRRVIVCPTTDNTSCAAGPKWMGYLMWLDRDGNGVPAASEIRQTALVRGTMQLWASAALSAHRIVLRPDGFAYNSAGALMSARLAACLPTDRPLENVRDITLTASGSIAVTRRSGGEDCATATPANP